MKWSQNGTHSVLNGRRVKVAWPNLRISTAWRHGSQIPVSRRRVWIARIDAFPGYIYTDAITSEKSGQLSRHSDGLWTGRPGFDYRLKNNLSLLQGVQAGSGAHPAPYPMGNGGDSLGGKAAGAWHWPFASIQCRRQEWWSYTFTPPRLHGIMLK
jgi:hypothetical protein